MSLEADKFGHLRNGGLTPRDILKACPFDHLRNLNGKLDEELFFDRMFHCEDTFPEEVDQIIKRYWAGDAPQVMVLHGHSGTGKSTFLRYFRRHCFESHEDVELKIIDFHALPSADIGNYHNQQMDDLEHRLEILYQAIPSNNGDVLDPELTAAISFLQEKMEREAPITSALRTVLMQFSPIRTMETILFIQNNRSKFHGVLSRYCQSVLRDSVFKTADDYSDFLSKMKWQDSIVIFFVRLIKRQLELDASKRKKLILCFDNLDILGFEYMSSEFLKGFDHVLKTLSILSQRKEIFGPHVLDFRREVRFMFVLRDANKALANRHIIDSLGPDDVFDFFATHHSLDIDKVLRKRLQLIEDVCDEVSQKGDTIPIDEFVEIMTNYYESFYFKTCIRTLFNYDLKKIVEVLHQLTLHPVPAGVSKKDLGEDYGIIGRFVFAISKKLTSVDIISDWFPRISEKNGVGAVVKERIVFTALLNLCGGSGGGPTQPYVAKKYVSLLDLIIACSGVVDDDDVFDICADAFLCHHSDWVGLVTFEDKVALARSDFNEEKEILRKARAMIAQKEASGLKDDKLRALLAPVSNISLKSNPATFALLRYLIIHYEFLSAAFGQEEPLFGLGAAKDASGEYKFVQNIDRVLSITTFQQEMMEAYCRSVILPSLQLDAESFRSTVLCFKYIGQGSPKEIGNHHSYRVVSQCIDYVDKFRLNLVSRHEHSPEIASDINKQIVARQSKFVRLLENGIDSAGKNLGAELRKKINKLENSAYLDFKTEVSVN